MIGFKLPKRTWTQNVMWMNFLKTAQALVDTRDASMEVSRMLRDYNAKIYPISDDQFGDYFVEFEREADMIYFKMEWSRSGSIQITSFPHIGINFGIPSLKAMISDRMRWNCLIKLSKNTTEHLLVIQLANTGSLHLNTKRIISTI